MERMVPGMCCFASGSLARSKRQKNDAADAEAICEAAQRPSMRFVPVKTEEQQANGIVFRARDLLVRQRTSASTLCAGT